MHVFKISCAKQQAISNIDGAPVYTKLIWCIAKTNLFMFLLLFDTFLVLHFFTTENNTTCSSACFKTLFYGILCFDERFVLTLLTADWL